MALLLPPQRVCRTYARDGGPPPQGMAAQATGGKRPTKQARNDPVDQHGDGINIKQPLVPDALSLMPLGMGTKPLNTLRPAPPWDALGFQVFMVSEGARSPHNP